MLLIVKKMLDRLLESLVITVMAVLVIDVVWQVFTRLVLKNPSQWTEELAVFMLIWVAMLGSAVALERGAHLGIDYFTEKLSARLRLYTELFVFCAVAAFSICVMIIGGIDLVASTLQLDQVSPALGVRVGYVYLAVPVSGFFILLYAGVAFVERSGTMINSKPAPVTVPGGHTGGVSQ
ncbi:MAG: TRAP transporter small permease [Chitinispirillaceae bacterium]|nr:TRAP transporter small permease [Chitinispirillaceae bacterium]